MVSGTVLSDCSAVCRNRGLWGPLEPFSTNPSGGKQQIYVILFLKWRSPMLKLSRAMYFIYKPCVLKSCCYWFAPRKSCEELSSPLQRLSTLSPHFPSDSSHFANLAVVRRGTDAWNQHRIWVGPQKCRNSLLPIQCRMRQLGLWAILSLKQRAAHHILKYLSVSCTWHSAACATQLDTAALRHRYPQLRLHLPRNHHDYVTAWHCWVNYWELRRDGVCGAMWSFPLFRSKNWSYIDILTSCLCIWVQIQTSDRVNYQRHARVADLERTLKWIWAAKLKGSIFRIVNFMVIVSQSKVCLKIQDVY